MSGSSGSAEAFVASSDPVDCGLQEFYYQVTRPSRTDPLTGVQAWGFIESIDSFPVLPVTLELFHSAVSVSRRFILSYWDGAILAAAGKSSRPYRR